MPDVRGKRYFDVKSSTYHFHVQAKTLADFQTWVSVL